MNKKYVYSSSLAPYIEGLINQKRADGYIYEYEAYILKTFDNFCIDNGFSGNIITVIRGFLSYDSSLYT